MVATATVVESFGVGRYVTGFGRKISWSLQRARLHDALARFGAHLPAEQTIAEIWSELLGIEQIGAHDSFLELGGDSLLAVRLISRLRDAFNQNVPLRLIFEASTVAELAKAIEPQSEADTELAEIMNMLEQLSEEDAERELLKRQQALTREATV